MKILGIIAEYNPFHQGHKYHLEESLKKSGADYSLALMSGSFLQRGEVSLVDKWTKAKMAVDNGVDLVLELPFIYAVQSAEGFAQGGLKLLDRLGVVDCISFGSESGDMEDLSFIGDILYEEPEAYVHLLRENLDQGLSFSVSRSRALETYIHKYLDKEKENKDYKNILKGSNNILAIEYLKAIRGLKSPINPVTIPRTGSLYGDKVLSGSFSSATAIRHTIRERGLESSKDNLPLESYQALEEYLEEYGSFNYLENYEDILIYLLRTTPKDKIRQLINIEHGLENRIVEKAFLHNDLDRIISSISSKRYPRTRIQRIMIHLLHDFYREDFARLEGAYPSYIRVLGMNENGFKIINRIKESSSLPIITKFANYKKLRDEKVEEIIYQDKKSTDIFFLGLERKVSGEQDFLISPYIGKK